MMKITVLPTDREMGAAAAKTIAALLTEAIRERGEANYLVSTGASQFSTFEALLGERVDWTKVTMFHLDEYIGLPVDHPASFQKYLHERFTDRVPLHRAVFVDGLGDVEESLRALEQELIAHPIDVGVIGIGENAHIAFNDPPADFGTDTAYHVVALDDACKAQQVREGWFASPEEVPARAISITPRQIMRCLHVISPVPGARKAQAVRSLLEAKTADPMVPASLLKEHPQFTLFLDQDSASLCSPELLAAAR